MERSESLERRQVVLNGADEEYLGPIDRGDLAVIGIGVRMMEIPSKQHTPVDYQRTADDEALFRSVVPVRRVDGASFSTNEQGHERTCLVHRQNPGTDARCGGNPFSIGRPQRVTPRLARRGENALSRVRGRIQLRSRQRNGYGSVVQTGDLQL